MSFEAEAIGERVRLKRRVHCTGCSIVLIGGRPRLCFTCEEAAIASTPGRKCIDCGDPVRGSKKRCAPCWKENDTEVRLRAAAKYRQKHHDDPDWRERQRAARRAYTHRSEENREKLRTYKRKFWRTEKGREASKRYRESEAFKKRQATPEYQAARRAYERSEAGRAAQRRQQAKAKAKRRQEALQRLIRGKGGKL